MCELFLFVLHPKRSPSYGQNTMGGVHAAAAGSLLPGGVLGPRPALVWLPPGGRPLLCVRGAGLFLPPKPALQAGSGTSAR